MTSDESDDPAPGRALMTVATEPASPQTKSTATGRMKKALVYHGPGKRAWEETPRPAIQNPTDAIVRITTSTICVPTCTS